MEYIAHRNVTIASLSGRSVSFEKGVPKFCPPQMHAELVANGIMPVEIEDEADKPVSNEPTLPEAREQAMFAAFEAMALRNRRGDFAGNGSPNLKVLATELGWSAVDAKERDVLWQKFQEGKAA